MYINIAELENKFREIIAPTIVSILQNDSPVMVIKKFPNETSNIIFCNDAYFCLHSSFDGQQIISL